MLHGPVADTIPEDPVLARLLPDAYRDDPEAAGEFRRYTEPALRSVWLGPVTTPDREPSVGERVSLFREPDAGNLPVRFDEREQETEPGQTGLR